MRPDVLVGSALLHGAAVALFVHWLPPKEAPPDVQPVAPASAERAVDPIEITIIDLPASSPAAAPSTSVVAAPVAAAPVRRHAGGASVTASAATHIETGTGGERSPGTHEPSGGGGLLHMRGADLALSTGTAERIASGGEPLHDGAYHSGKLESVAGGHAVIRDRVTTVSVNRDGTAHFSDNADIDVQFHAPIPHLDVKDDLRALGDALQDWYDDPYAATRYGSTSELSEANKAGAGMCDKWGDPGCDDPLASPVEKRARARQDSSVGIHGPGDITAYLYRKLAHVDPYASRKLKLLDDTRAERVERGQKFRAEQAARSAELMQRTLEQLWATVRDPAARKTALFELWQDCADDDAGTRARAMVLGWIRAKLPAGSPGAYTAEEQAKLDFAPYDDVALRVVSP